MYLDFFGLSSPPFSIAPDPGFLFLTARHEEALAHLLYGTTQQGGFILLTGEIGTGKTTLCRHFLNLVPDHYQTAFIFNPKISAHELLATICDEFGIEVPAGATSSKQLTDLLNVRLLEIHASGKNALLVIDEAQNLAMDVLEQVRLLTNLETDRHKLLQIILIGQPQLKDLLQREDLHQLSQRIIARYHLSPLSRQETADYVRHRLLTSGCSQARAMTLFPAPVLREIYRKTLGVPRLINVLCDRALLGAWVESLPSVSRRIVKRAAQEVMGDEKPGRWSWLRHWRAAGVALTLGAGLAWLIPSLPPLLTEIPTSNAKLADRAPAQAGLPENGTQAAAFRSLLGLWGVTVEDTEPLDDESTACSSASRHRLRCFSASNRSWQQFRQFNLPAVLTLRSPSGREFHAVIESASADEASLLVDGQPVRWSLQQLAFYWTGRFTLLWSLPAAAPAQAPMSQKALLALSKSPPRWLLDLLGSEAGTGVPVRERIMAFQRQTGLHPDGIVGMQTLVMLSSSTGKSPALERR